MPLTSRNPSAALVVQRCLGAVFRVGGCHDSCRRSRIACVRGNGVVRSLTDGGFGIGIGIGFSGAEREPEPEPHRRWERKRKRVVLHAC